MAKPSATQSERDNLAATLDLFPSYNGWLFSYDYPGYFVFSHENKPGLRVCCTPDWECRAGINVQIDDNGDVEDGAIIPWPKKGRTAEGFFELMKPWLDKYQPVDTVKVCCAVCGSPNVSYAIWHHPNNEDTDGDVFGSWNAGDNTFCDDCDDNSDLVDKGAEPKAFEAARAKWRDRQWREWREECATATKEG